MFFRKKIISKVKKILKTQKNIFYNSLSNERIKIISLLTHDIKTPILAQQKALEILLKQNKDEILKEIYLSNNFLLQMVNNAIFLQKYELEKPKLNIEKINITTETEKCIAKIINLANEKSQKLIFKNKKDIKIQGDIILVRKIIQNILTSSVSQGFENSNIEITIKENKNEISFQSKNKSLFMTKEKIKKLLEENKDPFSDLNQLGLKTNLNIAKKLIKAHNWNIIAQSKNNNETTFGFTAIK